MKNYWIVIIFLVFVMGCKKDRGFKTVYLEPQIKAKYGFKMGSYWIYRDSISGRVDSFYVFMFDNSKYPPVTYDKIEFESEASYIVQKINDISILDSVRWELVVMKENQIGAVYYRKMITKTITFYNFFTPNALTVNMHLGNPDRADLDGSLITFPVYTLGANTFLNVAEINYGVKLDSKNTSTYYFNDSVGYIKMRLNYDDGIKKIKEVWELQRWHVIK